MHKGIYSMQTNKRKEFVCLFVCFFFCIFEKVGSGGSE